MNAPTQRMKAEIKEKLGHKCLVFVGMMGCGKSAIGRLVANTLDLEFYDSDTEIEKAADMSVVEIFTQFGEEEFRRGEQKVIERLLAQGPLVLALGGGAFLSKDTRTVIEQRATSIWLAADIELLHERVMRKPGKRPLLEKGDSFQVLKDLLEARNPVYQLADLKIDSVDTSRSKTRDLTITHLHNYFSGDFTSAGNS